MNINRYSIAIDTVYNSDFISKLMFYSLMVIILRFHSTCIIVVGNSCGFISILMYNYNYTIFILLVA